MKEEEARMWERYGEGDPHAREELILYYLPLVRLLVSQISRNVGWASREDLMEDGVIGLMRAVERFDPKRGVEFRTFARYHIKGAVFESPEMTRVAPRQAENLRKVKLADDNLMETLRRKPTLEEVAKETGLNVEQVSNALKAAAIGFPAESITLEVQGSREGFERLQDLLKSGKLSDIDGVEIRNIQWGATHPDFVRTLLIKEALSKLSERESLILTDYYWSGCTDKEIADRLGLTEGTLKKIRQHAISRLRSLLQETRK